MKLNPQDQENVEIIQELFPPSDEQLTFQLLWYYFGLRIQKPDGTIRTPDEAYQGLVEHIQSRLRK